MVVLVVQLFKAGISDNDENRKNMLTMARIKHRSGVVTTIASMASLGLDPESICARRDVGMFIVRVLSKVLIQSFRAGCASGAVRYPKPARQTKHRTMDHQPLILSFERPSTVCVAKFCCMLHLDSICYWYYVYQQIL